MNWDNNSIKNAIHEYVDGNLSETETDRLWAELLGNPDALDYLQTLATLQKMGKDGKFKEEEKSQSNILHLLGHQTRKVAGQYKQYLAAASVLILGMAILFQVFTSVDPTAELSPIAAIEYDIERSADERTVFENHLQRAVSLSTAGDLDSAMEELNTASEMELTEEQSIELLMVKAAIYYNTGLFSSAAENFEKISNKEVVDRLNLEKSLWYLANTQIHLEKLDEARANIDKVIEMDGAFSRVATQKREKL